MTYLYLDLCARPANALLAVHLLNEGDLPRLYEVLGSWDGRSGSPGHVKECVGRRLPLATALDEVHGRRHQDACLRILEQPPEVAPGGVPKFVGVDWNNPICTFSEGFACQPRHDPFL